MACCAPLARPLRGRKFNLETTRRTKRPQPKKKRSKYWIGLLVFAIILAIAISLVLTWLYRTLEDYEKHTPQRALNQYFSQLAAGEYEQLKPYSGFTPGADGDWDAYFAILTQRFGTSPDALSFRRTAAAGLAEGEELYAVYAGEEKLGEVVLFPASGTDSGWAVRSSVAFLQGYTITAPEFVEVLVNGVPLDPAQIVETKPVTVSYEKDGRPLSVNIFSSLNDASLAPNIVQYQTGETLVEPQFAANASFGSGECLVEVDTETRTVTVSVPINPQQEEDCRQTMETVAKAYSDFITEDGPLSALRQYLYDETSLYKDFSEYQTGWYLSHESREFSNVTFSDIAMQSETCFTGHLDFTVTIVRQGKVHVFEPSYDMAFMYIGDEWLLVGLHARAGSDPPQAEA